VRLVRVAVLLPLSLLGVAATSAPYYQNAHSVAERDGLVVTGVRDDYHANDSVMFTHGSEDGLTWRYLTPAEHLRTPDRVATTTDCVPAAPTHCYRGVPDALAVEESIDGGATWRRAWEVSAADRERLAREYEDVGSLRDNLSCGAVLVHPVAGGQVVIAACGRDGFVRWDAAGGWQRIGFPPDGPPIAIPETRPPPVLNASHLFAILLFGWLAFAMGFELMVGADRRAWTISLGVAIVVGLVTGILGGSMHGFMNDVFGAFLMIGGGALAFGALIPWAILALGRPGLPRRALWRLLGWAVVTAVGVAVPLALTNRGVVPRAASSFLAFLVGVAGVAIAGALGALQKRRRGVVGGLGQGPAVEVDE
jgi:hypothetical protein